MNGKNTAPATVRVILLALAAALAFAACEMFAGGENGDDENADNDGGRYDTSGSTRTFTALNLTNNKNYTLTADLLAQNSYCKVWVERSQQSSKSKTIAANTASEYRTKIYPKMIEAFGIENLSYSNQTFNNTMRFADFLGDGDGKLTILLLDIKDGSSPGGSYVAGYFDPNQFFGKTGSNKADMIYLDTSPAVPGSEESYQTLAHEMQHLMNFATSVAVRLDGNLIKSMDLWIDEGLSSAAEYIYQGSHSNNRITWYNGDSEGTIASGNNFFVWENLGDNSILDDYSTVYLFFQWLRIQAGGAEIYKDIIGSTYSDYRAVTAAAGNRIAGYSASDGWPKLLETWLAANYINDSSGLYGYKDDTSLKNLTPHTTSANSISLLPGEGVYSITNSGVAISGFTNGSGNIGYAALKKGSAIDYSNTQADGALLTYNKNTDKGGSSENGYVTGVAAAYQGGAASVRLSAGSSDGAAEGPFRIDARDMLARNGAGAPAETFDLSRLAGAGND